MCDYWNDNNDDRTYFVDVDDDNVDQRCLGCQTRTLDHAIDCDYAV